MPPHRLPALWRSTGRLALRPRPAMLWPRMPGLAAADAQPRLVGRAAWNRVHGVRGYTDDWKSSAETETETEQAAEKKVEETKVAEQAQTVQTAAERAIEKTVQAVQAEATESVVQAVQTEPIEPVVQAEATEPATQTPMEAEKSEAIEKAEATEKVEATEPTVEQTVTVEGAEQTVTVQTAQTEPVEATEKLAEVAKAAQIEAAPEAEKVEAAEAEKVEAAEAELAEAMESSVEAAVAEVVEPVVATAEVIVAVQETEPIAQAAAEVAQPAAEPEDYTVDDMLDAAAAMLENAGRGKEGEEVAVGVVASEAVVDVTEGLAADLASASTPPESTAPDAAYSSLKGTPENQEAMWQLELLSRGIAPFDVEQDGHKFGLTTATLRPAAVEAATGDDVAALGERLPRVGKLQDRYDPVIAQLTRLLMRDGKLAKAQRDMAMVLNYLQTSPAPKLSPARPLLPGHPPAAVLPLDPVLYLKLAIDSVAPLIKIRSYAGQAGGGAALQVPVPLAARQRRRTVFMWLLDLVNKKVSRGSGRGMLAQRIGEEVVAIVEGRSSLWDRRQLLHKQGTSTRVNVSKVRL